jgi:hypothetical protein
MSGPLRRTLLGDPRFGNHRLHVEVPDVLQVMPFAGLITRFTGAVKPNGRRHDGGSAQRHT